MNSFLSRTTIVTVLIIALLLVGCKNSSDSNSEIYYQHLEMYLADAFPDHRLENNCHQIVVIPSFGCKACIANAIRIFDLDTLPEIIFISDIKRLSPKMNRKLLMDEDSGRLLSVELGAAGKPVAFQVDSKGLVNRLVINSTLDSVMTRLVDFARSCDVD